MMMIDVRFPMGLLFLALGLILTAAGIIDPDPLTSLQRKVGINVNLYWGITMVLFGPRKPLSGLAQVRFCRQPVRQHYPAAK